MAVTVTAAPDPTSRPPRVRVDVRDTGTTPAASVKVTRRNADGHIYEVRTSDGGPLILSAGAGTVYDYESPYGQTVAYTCSAAGSTSAATVLDVAVPWVIHVGIPARSRVAQFAPGSFASLARPISQGVYPVLTRPDPIVVNGGARQLAASSFGLMTETLPDADALELLLEDGSPLLLNVPPALGFGVPWSYIAVSDVAISRPSPVGTHPDRLTTVTYQTIGRPAGGTQAAITWTTVTGQYATWDVLDDAVPTWATLAAPTT